MTSSYGLEEQRCRSDQVVAHCEALGGVVAGHRELAHDPQPWPFDGCQLLVLERQDPGCRVAEPAQTRLEPGHVVLRPPLGERIAGRRQLLDQLDELDIAAAGGRRGPELGERLAGVDVPVDDQLLGVRDRRTAPTSGCARARRAPRCAGRAAPRPRSRQGTPNAVRARRPAPDPST